MIRQDPETPRLLADCARLLDAVSFHLEAEAQRNPGRRTAHLARTARTLVTRIEAVTERRPANLGVQPVEAG